MAPQRCNRTIPETIQWYSHEDPDKVWLEKPVNDSNLSEGFEPVTYGKFGRATDQAAHWLDAICVQWNEKFPVLAYIGPTDVRYPVIAVAAAKTGRQLLLPFAPSMSDQALQHLLTSTGCKAIIYDQGHSKDAERMSKSSPAIQQIIAPELAEWFHPENHCSEYPFSKSFAQAQDDPWLIFHTGGSTGFPKPVPYTHRMMVTFDYGLQMPHVTQEETIFDWYPGKRWYTSIPFAHFLGMNTTLQYTVLMDAKLVTGPRKPHSADVVHQMLKYGNLEGAILSPATIRQLYTKTDSFQCLLNLKYLFWGGAPLDKEIGNELCKHLQITPAIGTTESGGFFQRVRPGDQVDWEYFEFPEVLGIHFEPWADDLHHMVFIQDERYRKWQQVFYLYPHLSRYETNDLWAAHPTRAGLWRYVGRIDDMIVLSTGAKMHASKLEARLQESLEVNTALVGGTNHTRPCAIVEPLGGGVSHELQALWSLIEQYNQDEAEEYQIDKRLFMTASASKPFIRTAKNSVARASTLELYRDEIDQMYRAANIP